MYITELEDDLPEMLVLLIDHKGKINYNHDGNPDLLSFCQQCNDIVGMVNSALPEVPGTAHATTTHMAAEEITTLRASRESQASDRKCQPDGQTVRLLASLFAFDCDGS